MIKVNKQRMAYENYREDMAHEFGLTEIYAYHCQRCNYVWLPKDFDFNRHLFNKKTDGFWGHDLFFREPPKSCARCKSRSWKEVIPNRKLGKRINRVLTDTMRISEEFINQSPWINSQARFRALDRQGNLTGKRIIQA